MSHHSRKQNEQSSTKDFIKSMLQNLDLWTLRESLLEFKLMFELEKQKERYHEYFVECLAKTTVEFLIDPDRSVTTNASTANTPSNVKVNSINAQNKNIKNKNIIINSKNTKSNNNNTSTSSKIPPNLNNKNKPALSTSGNTNSKTVSRSISISNFQSNNTRRQTGTNMTANNNNNNNQFKSNNVDTESTIPINTDLDINVGDQDEIDYCHDELESFSSYYRYNQPIGIWLIGPLITKLQASCQLKVLEHASKTLQDIGKAFWTAKTRAEKETHAIKNITTWNQKPFFSLIMSFLKSKELSNNEKEVNICL